MTARRRALVVIAVLLVVSGTTAGVVIATRAPADNGRLTVILDPSRSAFPHGTHVRVQQGREPVGSEVVSGGVRIVSAARRSTVFNLRGYGRYFVMVIVSGPDGVIPSIGGSDGVIAASCVHWFRVNHSDHYLATIRLIGKQCRVDLSRNGVFISSGR